MSTYTITANTTSHSTSVSPVQYTVSLSRTGGQGSKGDSVTGASINDSGELEIVITDSAGVSTTVNAGSIYGNAGGFNLVDLGDTEMPSPADQEAVIYDGATSKFVTRKSTTNDLSDIDNTNKVEGSFLVWSDADSNYKSTRRIDNQSTIISGGSF